MKRLVASAVVLCVCTACVGMLIGAINVSPGSAVPDNLAAQLRGGCVGVNTETCTVHYDNGCTANNCSFNGIGVDADPGSSTWFYCADSGGDCYSCLNTQSCGGGS